MRCCLAILMLACAASAAAAQSRHRCAGDAVAKATPLLKLHYGFGPGEKAENLSIETDVRVLPPIRALKGNGRLDVLEVRGHIYKAEYRMRFIYMQGGDSCVLMGQEVIENSNPY